LRLSNGGGNQVKKQGREHLKRSSPLDQKKVPRGQEERSLSRKQGVTEMGTESASTQKVHQPYLPERGGKAEKRSNRWGGEELKKKGYWRQM